MNDLLRLYRHALRVGDRPLAELLSRVTSGDREVVVRGDLMLQAMPRGQPRWSAGAERALHRALTRIAAVML